MHRTARLLALVALIALSAGSARGGTPEQDLASLNALRDRNGIPAGITLNPDWSARCAQHVQYMRRTGIISHAEDPASPWYTDGGNWAAGHAVLAAGITWTPQVFLWETAPLHLAQLLAPQLSEIGIADDGDFVCATTWPGYLRPVPPTTTIFTYPGPGASIYASEESAEWPVTPAQALGLDNPTGPHLYVYQWGTHAVSGVMPSGQPIAIQTASLVGPDGTVAVRWADASNPTVGAYLTGASGIIIPVQPLAHNASYTAAVTFTNGVSYTWGFTTAVDHSIATLKDVRIVPRRVTRHRTCLRRRAGRCIRWRTVYHNTIAISGRFTSAERPAIGVVGADIGITFQKAQQAQLATGDGGTFRAIYRFTSRTRRFHMRVTITAGGGSSEYIVRFRIVNRPSGATLAVVDGIRPAPKPTAAVRSRNPALGAPLGTQTAASSTRRAATRRYDAAVLTNAAGFSRNRPLQPLQLK